MTTAIERHTSAKLTQREVAWIDASLAQIAKTTFLPKVLQNKPEDLRLVLYKGAELGLTPIDSIANLHPYDGRIIVSAAVAVRRAREFGHEVWPELIGPDSCTFAGHLRGRPNRVTRVTWTMEMAKAAGLVGKDNWRKWPVQMMAARASKMWVVLNCPEVLMGIDDGEFYYEDLAGIPENGAGAEVGGQVIPDDDEPVDAELVTDDSTEAWSLRWTALCREARCDRETSRWLLSETCGTRIDRAADVPPDMWAACETALAQWVSDMETPAQAEEA